MKQFSFRLEKVLKLKERMESLKRGEYGDAVKLVDDRQRTLDGLDTERERCAAEENEFLVGAGLNVVRLRAYSRYFNRLRGEVKVTIEIMRALEKDAEVKRKELIVSSREKKTLERYKEKLELVHLQEMDKAEQQELDELGAVQYVRNASRRTDL